MKLSDFIFDLPEELIAQYPASQRDESRLFVIDRSEKTFQHKRFMDIVECIPEGDIIVFNDTKVNPWRFLGKKDTGANIEILLLKKRMEKEFIAIGSPMKRLKKGTIITIKENMLDMEIIGRENEFIIVRIINKTDKSNDELFNEIGHIPLPPYIKREDSPKDRERYQTVYAKNPGAIAAPTAGLHFTEEILKRLRDKGVKIVYVTLHVGIGTFRPIKTENIKEHRMHEEEYEISHETAEILNKAIEEGKDIWAVGTTSVRTLESAVKEDGFFTQERKSTDLYIYPGYKFKVVKHIVTNFHLPGSSLVVMISAFAGRERLLAAYNEAIKQKYRFFSYGDAMLIV